MKKKWLWALIPLAVLIAAAAAWYFIVVDNIADEVIIEAGSEPVASDWLIRDLGIGAEFATDSNLANLTKPGLYNMNILYNGRVYPTTLRVRDTQAPQGLTRNLTAWSTQKPEAKEFLAQIADFTEVTVTYQAEPDMTVDGDQTVSLVLTDEGGNTTDLTATLTLVQDHTAPVIEGISQLVCYVGREVDFLAGVFATDDHDGAPTLVVDFGAVDLQKAGEYDIVYSATDAAGNCSTVITAITVVEDNQAPTLLGVFPRSLCVGSTIAYRSGVVIRDDQDANPTLTVDSSKVDLSQPGQYPLVYTATDAAGNENRIETTVTVHPKVTYYVDEEKIWAEADRIIGQLGLKGMTAEEQVRTIFHWIQHSFFYIHDTDAIDWKQNAYNMLQNGQGDCYSFFSLSKLLFERLGIPNIDVQRLRLPTHGSDHYWSMVSVDGGESWYHYDGTPFFSIPERFCLVTDAYVDDFSDRYNNYYHRDFASLPKTPTEAP